MTVRVGVNGFGRIGRNFFRAVRESGLDIEIVAVNDLSDNKVLAHLLKYDTILGVLDADVTAADGEIKVGDQVIKAFAERDPANIPWSSVGVDIVVESTGFFTDATKARAHVDAGGAKKVIISAPASNEDATIVMGVNEASTTRRTTPSSPTPPAPRTAWPRWPRRCTRVSGSTRADDDGARLHRRPEPAGQHPQRPAPCPRRRAEHRADLDRCGQGHRPGPARTEGQARRYALRVPTPTGSLTDLSFEASRETSVEEINEIVKKAADGKFLVYSTDPIVSSDIVTNPASSIFDAPLTKVIGNQVKVASWYDNEWGYSNRLADLIDYVGKTL